MTRGKPVSAVERGLTTVTVAVDEPEVADRILALIVGHPGLRLAGAEDPHEPDVRITDAVPARVDAGAAIVVSDRADAMAALEAGVAALLPECMSAAALYAAIEAVAEGLTVLSREHCAHLMGTADAGGLESEVDSEAAGIDLTDREQQVLQLLARGASNKVIARHLGITPHTAKFHVAAIAARLGAKGRTDAVVKAMRLGLVML